MNSFNTKVLIIALGYLLLNGCGPSTNAYLKSKNPNMSWMDKKNVKKKREMPRIFSYQDEKYLYCWDDASKRLASKGIPLFYKIDKKTLDIVSSTKADKDEKYNSYNIIWNEKANWIIFDDNKKNKIDEYKIRKISFDKLEAAKNLFRQESEKKNSQFSSNFYMNSDSTKVTYYSAEYIGKEDKVKYDVICFNLETMEKLWDNKYVFPHPIKSRSDVSGMSIMVNKNGEPHFLVKTYIDKKKEKKKNSDGEVVANYFFNYYVLNEAGKVEEYKIDTKGLFITDIDFPFNNQKNPVIAAYTYKKSNLKELNSIMFKQIDLDTKEVKNLKDIRIETKELDVYDEGGTKLKQSNNFQRVNGLRIQNIHQAADGSVYVLGEENTLVRVCTRDKNGERCTYYWRSGNILVTKIKTDGTQSWSKIIPKSQYINLAYELTDANKSGRVHSHKSMMIDDKLHIFFNDNAKNYDPKKPLKKIKQFTGAKASLIHVIMETDGKYEMIEALGPKDHPRIVDISSIKNIDDDHVFLFDYKTLGMLKIDR